MYNHLHTRHSAELTRAERAYKAELTASTSASLPSSATTVPGSHKRLADPTIEAVLAKRQTWDRGHPSAVLATKYHGEMIAIDLQPYSIVENEGFLRYSHNLEPQFSLPSRRHLSERDTRNA